MTIILLQLALAQGTNDFVTVEGPHLTPGDLSWGSATVTTIGAPAVFRHDFFDDPTTTYATGTGTTTPDPLLMVYEAQIGAASTECPAGEWGIGLAFSDDSGASWTDLGPLLQPTAGTYYSCVAAHPRVVKLVSDDRWVIYFKAEQDVAACEALKSEPSWGCDQYSGVGRLGLEAGISGTTLTYTLLGVASAPVLTDVQQDMGYPDVVHVDGRYRMIFAQNPNLYYTDSPTTGGFVAPSSPVITKGDAASGFGESEYLSPSTVCAAGSPYKVFVSGRTFMPYPTLIDQSWGQFTTTDWSSYSEGTGPYTSTAASDPEMRHVYAVSSDSGAGYAGFYSTPAKAGGNEIYSVSTASFDASTIDPKRCP